MRPKTIFLLAFLVLSVVVWVGRTYTAAHPQTQVANVVSAKAGAERLYPNASLTPGAVLTSDTAKVCTFGYAGSVRNVTSTVKKQVYAEYGVSYPQPDGSYEVDHFISLELGGSNDIQNLWLEPANPKPGFHEKDKVEDYLHNQVCAGKMSLSEAQKEIVDDWYAVYLKIAS